MNLTRFLSTVYVSTVVRALILQNFTRQDSAKEAPKPLVKGELADGSANGNGEMDGDGEEDDLVYSVREPPPRLAPFSGATGFLASVDVAVGITVRINVPVLSDSISKRPPNSRNRSRIPANPIPAPPPLRLN